MRILSVIAMLTLANVFMVLAWYGHLRFKDMKWAEGLGLFAIILIGWGIAFFEYCFQVPANKFGFRGNGGPFGLVELRILQEVISLVVFLIFTLVVFRNEELKWNHISALMLMVAAVYLVFRK